MNNTIKLIKCPLKSDMKMGKYCLTSVTVANVKIATGRQMVPKNHERCVFVPPGCVSWSQARELESVAQFCCLVSLD